MKARSAAPLISIVTPTLNQGGFIEHTIRSLLHQTFDDFEHIIIDGGSIDGTQDILRRYEGLYRMRWTSGPDDGMYGAVNKGLGMSTGRVHAYLNSDDLYFPWTLSVVAEHFADPSAAAVLHGDAINIDDVTGAEHVRISPAFDLDRLVYVWPLPQPAVFWRSQVTTELGGFDAALKYVGDWDFFIRAGRRFEIKKVDEFLAVERRHMASKTLGEMDPMASETRTMLDGYRDARRPSAARSRLRLRALAARRAAWLRFLLRGLHRGSAGPWGRLLSSSDVHIDALRLAAGFVPGAPYSWKAGAVRTGENWLRPQ